ncbi:hypothetical protein P8452_12017 [Trifolium repens]|jgi:hypothetical protein|nr:hypothetical protein P8452_12017 [Trifolium repens]
MEPLYSFKSERAYAFTFSDEEPTRKVSDEPSQHYGKPSWEAKASQLCFTFSVEEPARLSQPVSRMRFEITL